jgi:hypothetical protein
LATEPLLLAVPAAPPPPLELLGLVPLAAAPELPPPSPPAPAFPFASPPPHAESDESERTSKPESEGGEARRDIEDFLLGETERKKPFKQT